MRVRIKDKKEVAKGTLRVEFDTSGNKVSFNPGQYMHLNLIKPPETDFEGNSRFFSIVNPPNQKDILVMTTRLRDTAFKRVLHNLPIGAELEIDEIGGNFTLPKDPNRPLVFFAGGIGITPFMSMVQYIAEEKLGYKVTLLYSNRDKESTAYFDLLEKLAKENPNIKVVFIMTQDPNWQGEKRHVDKQLIKDYLPDPNSYTYYIAGPPEMVKAIYQEVAVVGVDKANIKTENFTGY